MLKGVDIRHGVLHTVTESTESHLWVTVDRRSPFIKVDLQHGDVVDYGCRNVGDDEQHGGCQQQESADMVEEACLPHFEGVSVDFSEYAFGDAGGKLGMSI